MNTKFHLQHTRRKILRCPNAPWMVVVLHFGIMGGSLLGEETIRGFTEPNRTVQVATSETGIIRQIHVAEGAVVTTGQPLATLDDDLHVASLQILAEQMNAKGRLESARAELRLRQTKLEMLTALQQSGNARNEEVDRAKTDVAISSAQLSAIQEELAVRELEHRRAEVQLERRSVKSPLEGVITKQHKQAGELVASHDARLFEIVQLDPLLAVFPVPSSEVSRLKAGLSVSVDLAGAETVTGTVAFVSPITDGESGTVKVNVRIANPLGLHRSGEHCTLHLPQLLLHAATSNSGPVPSESDGVAPQ